MLSAKTTDVEVCDENDGDSRSRATATGRSKPSSKVVITNVEMHLLMDVCVCVMPFCVMPFFNSILSKYEFDPKGCGTSLKEFTTVKEIK